MDVTAALWCMAGFLALSLLAIGSGGRGLVGTVIYAGSAGLSLVLAVIAVHVLLTASDVGQRLILPLGVPWIGARFHLDCLSAFFLLVLAIAAGAASLYAIGYGAHEEEPERVLPFYPAFLAGMTGVLLADDAFTFLVAWEFMSLASWALVMARHRDPENRRAGYIYLVMASLGALLLLLAFGLLAGPEGAYDFTRMARVERGWWIEGVALVLVLIGTGSKAGLAPLHVWLPLAHPAAPSHVSALMSGAMTKIAVYAFIRIVFGMLSLPSVWWAIVVMLAGAATAALGVLFAMIQRDLKRLLAYSTIENIGIIFIALGLALAFRANGIRWAAAVAFAAALLHVFNHALFKNLLFLGAGAVLSATGERDIEKLGGLIHRMPRTAFLFLGGCVAISALPPLNGFVSEWLVFQAVLMSPILEQWSLKLAIPAVGVTLALSAALCAATFVRAYGIVFLSRPRSLQAASAGETDRWSLGAMALLLGLCLAVGILPGLVIDLMAPALDQVMGATLPVQRAIPWLSFIPIAEGRSSYNGMLVFVFILSSTLVTVEIVHRFGSRQARRGPAWDCGFPGDDPGAQYSASSFAQPVRRVYGNVVFGVRETVEMPPPGDPRPAHIRVSITDYAWRALFARVGGLVDRTAGALNALQFLTIRQYLSLVFAALVLLLLMVATWR